MIVVMETIGDRIRILRTAKGWSQDKLAQSIGVSRVAVTKWENGDSKNLKLDNLMRLCELFFVSPEYLIYGNHSEGKSYIVFDKIKQSIIETVLETDNKRLRESIDSRPGSHDVSKKKYSNGNGNGNDK